MTLHSYVLVTEYKISLKLGLQK